MVEIKLRFHKPTAREFDSSGTEPANGKRQAKRTKRDRKSAFTTPKKRKPCRGIAQIRGGEGGEGSRSAAKYNLKRQMMVRKAEGRKPEKRPIMHGAEFGRQKRMMTPCKGTKEKRLENDQETD